MNEPRAIRNRMAPERNTTVFFRGRSLPLRIMVTNRSPLGLNVAAIASGSISSKVFSIRLQPTLNLNVPGSEPNFSVRSARFQITMEAAGQEIPLEMTMQLIKEGGKWKVESTSD